MALNLPPKPTGYLTLQAVASPKHANVQGDISGGWLMSQMDEACAVVSSRVAKGRVAAVSVSKMNFLQPVPVGSVVGFYCQVQNIGFSSIQVFVEVWCDCMKKQTQKVTEAEFVFVAIDDKGKTREVDVDL